jgi:class 3 adenylate cyclase
MNGLLLIDDEEGIRRSLMRALEREPYQVYAASDGAKGIHLVKENLHHIHTVISDFRMPGLDGLETLREIGRLNPEITRIILTGYATMEAAIQSTNLGIDGFLTKPFDNMELRAKIHEISVRKRLKQFVPEQVYQEIEHSSGILKPKHHKVTILFSDIRGFTRMSKGSSPESLVKFLNEYFFTPMGEIAYAHHGAVDKHIGDSMMVVYGVPLHQANDALMAVRSAIAMQETAKKLHHELVRSNGFRLRMGIGISTGTVYSGILGSLRKKEYTSIGMAVNMAAKLQAAAREGEILVTRETLDHLPDEICTQQLEPLCVKGIDDPVAVYRVAY